MKVERLLLASLLISTVILALVPTTGFPAAFGSATISVPSDFPTIQAAIDNASDGDTIFVSSGTYAENVIVNKPVTLIGENESTTFIDAGGVGVAVRVIVDNVSITGFTIGNGSREADGAGVLLDKVRYVRVFADAIASNYACISLANSTLNSIYDVYVSDCNMGVNLSLSNSNILQTSIIGGASADGIYLSGSSNNTIQGNTIINSSGYGIRLESSGNCTLNGNRVEQNVGGAISTSKSPNCNITMNTLVANGYGVVAQASNNTQIDDNVILNNKNDGTYFTQSGNCSAQNNDVRINGGYGINLLSSGFSTIANNRVGNNTLAGIHFYTCLKGQVVSNVASYNQIGIFMQSCSDFAVNLNEVIGSVREGILLVDSPNNTFSTNTVLNSTFEGLKLQNSVNLTLDGNVVGGNGHYGIWVQQSPNTEILNSNISSNSWDGVYLAESNFGRVLNSVMNTNGGGGSRLYMCSEITIAQDDITDNAEGLRIFLTNDTEVRDNKIVQNHVNGLNMYNCSGNRVYHNSFVNNTQDLAILAVWTTVWDDGYPGGGNYWKNFSGLDVYWGPNQDKVGSDGIIDNPFVINQENTDRYPLTVPNRVHDLTLAGITLPANEVYHGWTCAIDISVKNIGGYVETVNVTAYCGDVVLGTRSVENITVGKSSTVYLVWDISSFGQCQAYDIRAEALPVLGESDIEDNYYDFGVVKVKMTGDVNSDQKVDILDIAAIAKAFNSRTGELRYKLNYDMNFDYLIDIIDIALAARDFTKTCI